jgi:putative FmdB family regulatory protein
MPFYEYRCDACNHNFEALQKISDDALVECPACHQPSLKKLISAAGFRLKGQGWYETDFKSGSKRNLADSGSSDSTPSAGHTCGTGCSH